jgi:hypothetical protein
MNAVGSTLLNASLSENLSVSNSLNTGYIGDPLPASNSAWSVWTNWYYPTVIRESYPVYLQERAQDKGKQAFEIIKALQDKKLMKLDKVSDFIEAMDTLIKTL